MPRTYTTAHGLRMRAGRAHEDPGLMTLDGQLGFLAKYVVEIIRENPCLDDKAVAKGARLKLKAHMAVLAEKSAAARQAKQFKALVAEVDATGLPDCGSDGIDA